MDTTQALEVFAAVKELARASSVSILSKTLAMAPSIGKAAVCVLFLINVRSWPMVWHIRVFKYAYLLRARHKLVMMCAMFKSPAQKLVLEDKWLASITPIGENPLTITIPYGSWASIDDSDFNGHLSNSSYGKTCDSARFKAALKMFPRFFPLGGWMALAATHYHFIREIPIFASYEVRTSVAAWDHKWVYVMSRFVRKPDGKKKEQTVKVTISAPPESDTRIQTQMVPLRTPADETISSTGTPFPSGTPNPAGIAPTSTQNALNAVAAGLAGPEPDGAILHTIVISQMCFKIGRITVPPALVFALNGFTNVPGFSHTNPHPEWAKVQEQLCKPFGGSARKAKKFLEGGWREVPEGGRWWEEVMGGEIEVQRVRNLERVDHLRRGLEGARTL